MIRLKDSSVKVEKLTKELQCKLIGLANICKSIEGERYTMTITSAVDGKHMKGSKHYRGEAIDIRKFDMKNVKIVVEEIKEYLGKDYDVIEEKTHIHIEYDKK
jgi:hypothetical protein